MSATVPPVNEQQFMRTVIDLAHLRGWRVAHFRPAQNSRGQWRTPVAADGAGFPDLVLVRDRLIFAELKTTVGRLSPEQVKWRDALIDAGQDWYCWRPDDLPTITRILR